MGRNGEARLFSPLQPICINFSGGDLGQIGAGGGGTGRRVEDEDDWGRTRGLPGPGAVLASVEKLEHQAEIW